MTSISGTKAFHFLKAPNHFEIFCFTNQLIWNTLNGKEVLFINFSPHSNLPKNGKLQKRCLCLKQIHTGEQSLVH